MSASDKIDVRNITMNLSRPAAGRQGHPSIHQNASKRQNISRVPRGELEDRFLGLYEESVHLKQRINTQDDKIKKLGTKLIRLAKDCSSMKDLTTVGPQPENSTRDMKMKIVERLQEIVWTIQMDTGARSLEVVGRTPTSLLTQSRNSLLEEKRDEIRHQKNVIEIQRSRIEELEQNYELLQDELRKKEEEHKQLGARFLQLDESQKSLSVCCNAAVLKVEELSAQLQDERRKSLDLRKWLQSIAMSNTHIEQLHERLRELLLERDLLKENNEKLFNSGLQQQQLQVQEQQLKLQIAQLETVLQVDNTEAPDNIKAERVYELTDPAGLPVGHVEVTVTWRFVPQSGSVMATGQPEQIKDGEIEAQPEQKEEKKDDKEDEKADEMKAGDCIHLHSSLQVPIDETQEKRAAATKKPEEDEGETPLSEGQPLAVSSHSVSEDCPRVPEEICEVSCPDVEEAMGDSSGSMQPDSDGRTAHGQTAARKPSEQMRVAILSLSLKPESWVARDSSVARVFVEYSLLDLPSVETTWPLPKPPRDESVSFNYSKVVPVDAENNGPRRQLLRDVLLGRNPDMEKIRFTVVSEMPEEEEQQARRYEDVGVAFVRIPEILEKQQDLTETSLEVRTLEDSSEVVGRLTVSVEALEILQAILEDGELQPPVTAVLPSA